MSFTTPTTGYHGLEVSPRERNATADRIGVVRPHATCERFVHHHWLRSAVEALVGPVEATMHQPQPAGAEIPWRGQQGEDDRIGTRWSRRRPSLRLVELAHVAGERRTGDRPRRRHAGKLGEARK